MIKNSVNYICPCCGYDGLKSKPYEKDINLPVSSTLSIPYCLHFGEPSYEVCDCCGYEFGNDDEPGTAPGVTFSEYLQNWIRNGCNWFNPKKKRDDWDIDDQLRKAKIQ